MPAELTLLSSDNNGEADLRTLMDAFGKIPREG
jgi:hypothetical protein